MQKTFFWLCFVCCSLVLNAQEAWVLKKNEKGVKVYTQQMPDARVVTFKAISVLPHSQELLLQTITDIKNYHKWIDGIAAGRFISRTNESDFYFRQIVLLPFPFDDREVVQQSQILREKGSVKIKITEANHIAEPLEGHVRMYVSHGYWLLEPVKDETKITYVFTADPGENIPKWLINSFIVESPFQTLVNLRNFLATD